jgi:hypothetical protein
MTFTVENTLEALKVNGRRINGPVRQREVATTVFVA